MAKVQDDTRNLNGRLIALESVLKAMIDPLPPRDKSNVLFDAQQIAYDLLRHEDHEVQPAVERGINGVLHRIRGPNDD